MHESPAGTLLIGQRTTPGRGTGTGLVLLRRDAEADTWDAAECIAAVNAGATVLHPSGERLYVAHGDSDQVSEFAVRRGRRVDVDELGSRACGGTNPVDIALSPGASHLVVANHGSGTVAVMPLTPDGELHDVSHVLHLPGSPGPHKTDQTGSKPHQVSFSADGSWLFVPDKGLDCVFVIAFEEETGELRIRHTVDLRQMAGPRHIAHHPHRPFSYVVNELDNTVVTLDTSPLPEAAPRAVQILPTPPASDVRDTRAAEILVHPGASRVYVSNRSGAGDRTPGGPGHDWIAVFTIKANGSLECEGHLTSGGVRPRRMALAESGAALLVANEKTGEILRAPLDAAGAVGPLRRLAAVASPVSILEL